MATTPATFGQYAAQVKLNTYQLLVLVDQVIAAPTQANIDAVVQGAFGMQLAQPKPTYSVDGESIQWESYRQALLNSLLTLDQAIQREGGPYLIQQRNRI